MNATTTYLPVTVGSGKAVHLGADRGDGYGPSVDCGAVRYRNITTRSITRQRAGTEATCTKCLKAAAARAEEQAAAEVTEAPAAKKVSAATAVREEVTATVTEAPAATHAFTASTEDARRCTCGKSRNVKAHGYTPSRGAGRVAAEKLTAAAIRQAQAADTAQAAEDAVAAVYANFTANRRALDNSIREAVIGAVSPAAAKGTTRTEEGAVVLASGLVEGSPETNAAEQAEMNAFERKVERVALGTVKERKPAVKAPKVKAPKEEAPAPTSQIGKGVVRFTLTTEAAGTVAYTSGSQINRDYALAVQENRTAVLRTIKGHIIRQHSA